MNDDKGIGQENAMGLSQLRLADFIDFLPDATMMINRRGEVVFWNHAMEILTGVPASKMIGKGNYEYALPFYAERRPILVDLVLSPEMGRDLPYDIVQQSRDLFIAEMVAPNMRGGSRHLWAKAALVYNDRGEIVGAVETVRDITEIREKERVLQESEDKYRRIFENIQDVYYEVAMDGTFVEISPSVENLFGYSRENLLGTSIASLYADPEKRRVFLRDILETGRVYDYEIVFKPRQGSLLHIAINTRLIPGRDGATHRIVGSMRDTTSRKHVEDALRASEERYRTLIENIPIAVNRTTPPPNGRILMANPAFLRMFGISPEEEITKIDPAKYYFNAADREQFSKTLLSQGSLTGYEIRFQKTDGTPVWGAMTAQVVYEGNGNSAVCFNCVIEDITERKKSEETIRRLAYYDSLTGLPNRTLFRDRFTMALARADRNKEKVVLMMFDLDHFKNVNDTMGHPVGDLLLKAVADRLRSHLRKSDTIARLGGDEFTVIYSGINPTEQVTTLARKLLNAFEEPFLCGGYTIRITASVGVVVYPEDATDIDMMVRNADIALYQAKNDGRGVSRRYVEGEISEKIRQ
jgi:diguanylate cyclase (GGDEF)-like protein/PAS domain S-box-containing protein